MAENIKDIISKRYIIDRTGKVYNRMTKKELKFFVDEKGYMKSRMYCPEISTNKDGRKPFRLHRLVAMFHLDTFTNELQVNHKNGLKNDNRVENLEMVNNSQNQIHAWKTLDSSSRLNKLNQRRDEYGKFK